MAFNNWKLRCSLINCLDRFNNQRVITSAIFQQFLDQPTVTSASLSVRNHHDTTKECLLAFTYIGYHIMGSNANAFVVKKLDNPTLLMFEHLLANTRRMPVINEYFYNHKELLTGRQNHQVLKPATLHYTKVQNTAFNCFSRVASSVKLQIFSPA